MVYTVTFSPAIDYVVHMDELMTGSINRAERTAIFFGGKGINVSMVLKELGVRTKALGFVAGFTGEAIEKGIAEKGIETDFIHLDHGFSRINVKVKAGRETELNGQGPVIGDKELKALYAKLDRLQDGDTLVLAGSVPDSMPADVYEKILERLSDRRIKTVVDATKDLLKNVLKSRPFLVKPNHHELGELFGVTLQNNDEIAKYAARLKSMGAANVLVSKAEKGALLLDENGAFHTCGACRGTVINSVGAGDSMVAGFLAGAERGDYGYALKLGAAAGGATAFSEGLAQKNEIFELLKQLS
jgi:1-phosphofructokinase